MILTEKTTPNNNDGISQNSRVPLSSMWSENIIYTGNNCHPDSNPWAAGPSRGFVPQNNHMEDSNSHLYRPYTSAIVLNQQSQEVPIAENRRVLRCVEVDVVSGRIRFEMEPQYSADAPLPATPMSTLSSKQKSWLTVFVRRWARKTLAMPCKAARVCTTKVPRGVRRSVKAMKHVSVHSASIMRQMSMKGKDREAELNQNQESGPSTKMFMKRVGKNIKKPSNSTACGGMHQASVASARSFKEYDEGHDSMRKSKQSAKKGGKLVRSIWNGKPTREAGAAGSTTFEDNKENQEI